MIAIFSALDEEIRDFKKGIKLIKTLHYKNCRIYEGLYGLKQNCLLVLTGIGREFASQAARMIIHEYPVSLLVSTGFGGGLNDRTGVGDIVVYSKLICENGFRPGSRNEAAGCLEPGIFPEAFQLLKQGGFHYLPVKGITVNRICQTPETKRELGYKFTADVVDMESYWIGEIAMEHSLPFITVRSIFDTVQDDISLTGRFTTEENLGRLKALGYLMVHPLQIQKSLEFFSHSRKAGKNLSVFLRQFIEEIQ